MNNNQENIVNDQGLEASSEGRVFNLAPGEGNQALTSSLEKIQNGLVDNSPITKGMMDQLRRSIDDMKLIIDDEEFSFAELKKVSNVKQSLIIMNNMEKGQLGDIDDLTFLTTKAAKVLIRTWSTVGISLDKLEIINDGVAEALSHHRYELFLPSLKTLSDKAAENLGQHRSDLELSGIASLSGTALRGLAQHQGPLTLGLTELSDEGAQILSQMPAKLVLNKPINLSDQAVSYLAQKSNLFVDNPTLQERIDKAREDA